MSKPGVIVLGGHVQGLGICRVLGCESIPIVVIDETRLNLARHSRYCEKFYKICKESLLATLLSNSMTSMYQNWLILPTNDHYVKILSMNKPELEKYYHVGSDKWEIVRLFYYKSLTYPLVKSLGIPLPKTVYFDSYDDLLSKSIDLVYPVIIKPSIMVDFYRVFKTKAIMCETRDILLTKIQDVLQVMSAKDILVQGVIPGDPHNQYSVGLLCLEGKILNSVSVRRARQHPLDFGNATTFALTVDIPRVINYAEDIMKKTQYTGMAEVEFKFDERDGTYSFLEVNPRTWKWHTITQAAGCNMLLNYYNYIYGYSFVESTPQEASWTHDILDFPITILMKIRGMIIERKFQNNVHATWQYGDYRPTLYELLYLPVNLFVRS